MTGVERSASGPRGNADVAPPPTPPTVPANPAVTSVSAFFPCYNDAPTIGGLVRDVHAVLERIVPDFEVIVVDDGSTDGSGALLDELAGELPRLRVVHHERNRGYGGALISGFAAASKDWVFYTDGDGQYDAREVGRLVEAADLSTDIVQGWKIARGDPVHRRIIGRVYHHTVRTLFDLRVRDTDCDFRLIRRSLLERVPLHSTSGVICAEMMHGFARAGAKFVEVPVHHYHRPHGRSQFFRIPHLTRTALQLLRLWWRVMVRGGSARAPR